MGTLRRDRRDRGAPAVEAAALVLAAAAAAFVLAAAVAAVLAAWLPDAQALYALACIRFYFARGCLP